jgi:alkanesulfonate monooxygenase SsuD/methylene tetrahydromethanopterin reductase-like flavin-dependent oxidoreductase (luciferase family)
MRFGIVVDRPDWTGIAAEVETAAAAGLDCCWIPECDLAGAPRSGPATACALRPLLRSLATLIEISVGSNPIGLAEEIAVADQILGGRVVAVLVGDDVELANETVAVVEPALASRPFRHRGRRWTLPREGGSVLVTPPPAQLALPVWLAGMPLAGVAEDRDLGWVADEMVGADAARAAWEARGSGAARHRRAAIRADVTVDSLSSERDAWGLDLCVVRLPGDADSADRLEQIRQLGRAIRPHLQGSRIPEALAAAWSGDGSTWVEVAHERR